MTHTKDKTQFRMFKKIVEPKVVTSLTVSGGD